MKACDPSWVLAVYEGFTRKTSFLTSRKIAEKTLIKKAAVIRVPYKKGQFYLLGPHLEHPKFKEANQFIIDAVISETGMVQNRGSSKYRLKSAPLKEKITGKQAKELLLSIRRELSNSRIVAASLEFLPIQWLIGQKVYEPQKMRVYLESMWKRMKALEKNKVLILEPGLYSRITSAACQITLELRRIKQQIDENLDSLETAVKIFDLLHVLSSSFFDLYFATLFNGSQQYHEGIKSKVKIK